MSRSAKVYIKGIYAGLLTEIDREHYSFCYDTDYYNNPQLPAVSLTMPKTQQEYTSSYLFPVFFNMTSEGDIVLFKLETCILMKRMILVFFWLLPIQIQSEQ